MGRSLQSKAPIGTLIVPTGCVREEGTSPHYVGDEAALAASRRLVQVIGEVGAQEGAKIVAGPVWSIDAPYRETVSKINAYQARGVLGVDMETSAMYALGVVRRVEVCNLLVVSDELWHEWKPAFGTPELEEATRRGRRVVLQTVRRVTSE